MIIKRAEVMGFCMGVKAAMKKAYLHIDESGKSGRPVYTYGPLIHNPLVMKELGKMGVKEISSHQEFPEHEGGVVIIRAHGVAPAERAALEAKGALIVDGTCPRVLRSQKQVKEAAALNKQVIIAGDPRHGEVIALAGYSPDVVLIETPRQACSISITKPALIISQTTLDREQYENICSCITSRSDLVEVVHSICPATAERQEALKELIQKVDCLLVVGGKNSANTKNLFSRALQSGKPAWHIEKSAEIPDELFTCASVGITAGASTPEHIIQEIERKIRKHGETQ